MHFEGNAEKLLKHVKHYKALEELVRVHMRTLPRDRLIAAATENWSKEDTIDVIIDDSTMDELTDYLKEYNIPIPVLEE